jgi:hypothetical protein
LLGANRALGAALTRLARDAQPGPRLVGAELAAAVAELVEQAAAVAVDSTTAARRAGADVAARLPRLLAQLDQAQARIRHLSETPPPAAGLLAEQTATNPGSTLDPHR